MKKQLVLLCLAMLAAFAAFPWIVIGFTVYAAYVERVLTK